MKAYKFRTIENLHLIVDIIVNRRLYCCRSDQLNDIREADVRVGNDEGRVHEIIEFGDQVMKRIRELRVCSLSKSFNNHLLWAHYAGGYTGVAVEIDLEDTDVTEVLYGDNFIFLSELEKNASPEDAARQVLARKYRAWNYEQEVRLVTKTEFYPLTRGISRIIVGYRTAPVLGSAPYLMCEHFGIALDRMVVADGGIYTVGAQPTHL